MVALRFTCDMGQLTGVPCAWAVNVAVDGSDWSPSGWVDTSFDLPDDWSFDANGKVLCPEHRTIVV